MSEPLVQASLIGEAVDDAPVLVLVADEDGKYLAVSRHACEVLGYTRAELLALSVPDVARYPDAAEEFASLVAAGRADGVSTVTRKDGTELEFRFRAAQVRVAGMTLYVAVAFEDLPAT